jgi:rod shape-determining protein MreC
MFSKKMLAVIGVIIFILTNFTILTISSKGQLPENSFDRFTIALIAPFQMMVSRTIVFTEKIWKNYFSLVSVSQENAVLKDKLSLVTKAQNHCRELELENRRLRKFFNFQTSVGDTFFVAGVIGRDPSLWFKTIMIDKGTKDGLVKGLPVLVSEGIVGQVVSVSENYSRVLLITDRSSAVDAQVQNSRIRGIVKGNNTENCIFEYVLRKDDIEPGDVIVSSGLDGVFPKGLRIGAVLTVHKGSSHLFQKVVVKTFVDFDTLEEVLVCKRKICQDKAHSDEFSPR